MQNVADLLWHHLRKYPGMQPVDCLKLLYQREMGIGHLLADVDAFRKGLAEELRTPGLLTAQPAAPEGLGTRFSRVYLSGFDKGSSLDSFTRLCQLAAEEQGNSEALQEDIKQMRRLATGGQLPYPGLEVGEMLGRYVLDGCPQPRHSQRYRALYKPHYRVVKRAHGFFLPVLTAIDKVLASKPHVLVGVDGMSAAGKSSLAVLLQQVYGGSTVHADDFFLQPEQRSAARLSETGGNIDYERLAPVAAKAADDRAFCYTKFDCQTGRMGGEREVPAGRVTVLEGVYALHPKVGAECDVRVFLSVDATVQAVRIETRSPALAGRFKTEWIPLENRYFREWGIRQGCDVVVDTTRL